MKRIFPIVCLAISALCVGCAVHDGHEDEPAPIWWPTFLYRPTTHPTDDEYNQTKASPDPMPDWAKSTAFVAAN